MIDNPTAPIPESPAIQIKGWQDGLLITLRQGEWPDLENELLAHVARKGVFFDGARVALDVGPHILRAADLRALRERLKSRKMALWAVISRSGITEANARALGFATQITGLRPGLDGERLAENHLGGEDALVFRRTLRAGFEAAHAGHVIVVGDVHPGAEVVAGGSIVVWGRLNGAAFAGVDGNQTALICALQLAPAELQIAGQASGDLTPQGQPGPAQALLRDGHIVIEPWSAGAPVVVDE